ncbi:hypothetical protein N7501_006807 [Penicillium viridicatum]|nr:hypothetical protein N7501_006807 [Penicillium viridicatum]
MLNAIRDVLSLGQKTCGRKSVPQDVHFEFIHPEDDFASLSLLYGMPVFKRITLLISRRVALKHEPLAM